MPSLGILGAGKLGITLAQLAVKAGYQVHVAGSGAASKIALTVQVLAPGAVATTAQQAAAAADIVVLAIPLSKYQQLPAGALAGKLVIDATNYWWETDGERSDFMAADVSTSVAVQHHLPGARVVKALNHMGYHDLHDEARPAGSAGRKAIAIAGDAPGDVVAVGEFIHRLGFDPLPIGELADGVKLEPGGKVFGANVAKSELQDLLL